MFFVVVVVKNFHVPIIEQHWKYTFAKTFVIWNQLRHKQELYSYYGRKLPIFYLEDIEKISNPYLHLTIEKTVSSQAETKI